jgi:integrase/recombinase XerD
MKTNQILGKILPKWIARPKKKESLPNIIPEQFIKEKLYSISNLKHKTILSLTYSIGLRRGDIQNLKIDCIDSKSMQIKIVEGKGNKDAYLPLTEKLLKLLRKYYKEYKPKEFLFEGQKNNVYSGTSLNNITKKYFGKQYHFHNIRHSTATHLLNKGIDISFIQKLLRHKDIKTTLIYLRISTMDLQNLPLY